jgi:hypothetical protein
MTRTDKVRISISTETVAGTTDVSPTAMTLAHTDYTEAPSAPRVPNDQIRTDARVQAHAAVNRSANFSLTSDLIFPTASEGLRSLIVSALNASESSTISTSLSGVGNGIFNDSGDPRIIRSTGSFVSDGWAVGDIGFISSANDSADNRAFRVLSVNALEISVELTDTETWAEDSSATINRHTSCIDNSATSEQSYTLEMAYLDEGTMDVYTGMVVDTMDITFAMGQKSTIRFGFVGRDATYSQMSSSTVGITGTTYSAPTIGGVFTAAGAIAINISGNLYPVKSATISTSRGLRQRFSTEGGATPDAIVPGRFNCSLQLSMHREVLDLLQLAKSGYDVPIWLTMKQGVANYITLSAGVFALDSVTSRGGPSGGDVMVNVSGAVTYDSSSACCLKIGF